MTNKNIKGQVIFHDKDNHIARLKYEIKDGRFSMSGNTQGCYGQCKDSIKPKTKVQKELLKFWDEYHLNDMHAGTQKQEKAIKEYFKKKNKPYNYDEACEYLKSIKLYSVTEKNGSIIHEPYKYGHSWITEKLPESFTEDLIKVIEEIEEEEDEYLKTRDEKINNTDDLITALMEEEGIDDSMFDACKAYLENFYPGDADSYDLSDFEEAYEGEYSSDEDFAREMADNTGAIDNNASWPNNCIDWEQASSELMHDYTESNGYYFRNV